MSEVPKEEPPRTWVAPPDGGDREALERLLTTWTCIDAFSSHYDAKRHVCTFRNLYAEAVGGEGIFVAHIVRNQTSGQIKKALELMRISVGTTSDFGDWNMHNKLQVREHSGLEAFAKDLRSGLHGKVVQQEGLTLAFAPLYHFNVGHGLFDGLYPAFVSLVQLGVWQQPFRAFVMTNWEGGVESHVPGMYNKVERIFAGIGGLEPEALTWHKAGWGAKRGGPHRGVIHRFDEVIAGAGTNGQKHDANVNTTLGACRELDACRAFRKKVFDSYGVPLPRAVRSTPPFRVTVVENKRYGKDYLRKKVDELLKETRPGQALADFEINFVSWSPGVRNIRDNPSLHTGNFTHHLEIISETDVHMSGPGTGQMYQTFLPDGAVHINLGFNENTDQGYMEEYMAEGAPYLRALFYPRYKKLDERIDLFENSVLVGLLQEAGKLLRGGLPSRPPPIGAKLSPVAKVFKAYCYWAHREKFGLKALRSPLTLREIKGLETYMGVSFPQDMIYDGTRGRHTRWKPDQCILGALRASFDKTFPDSGARPGEGWFGTMGVFEQPHGYTSPGRSGPAGNASLGGLP